MTEPPHQGRCPRPRVVIPTCQGTGAESQSWPLGQMILPSLRGRVSHRLRADSGVTPHSHDGLDTAGAVVDVVEVVVVVVLDVVVDVVVAAVVVTGLAVAS